MYRAHVLNVGHFNKPAEYHGYVGICDLIESFELIFLYDESDEIFSFVPKVGEGKSYVALTDYGVADAISLRALLPEFFAKRWNDILLSSIDYDEINEEGLFHIPFSPRDDVKNPMRPFFTKPEFATATQFSKFIAIRSIAASYDGSCDSENSDIFTLLSFEGLSKVIELPLEALGTIDEFVTDSELLCFIEQ